MNPIVYRLGIRVINTILRIGSLAKFLTTFSRAWLRHATLRTILLEQQFDGVIDGGANVGEFAAVVRLFLPACDLLCVEPHPGCVAALRQQGYRVLEAALWREKGTLTLSQPTPETTSCTVLPENGSVAKSTWTVSSIALQDLEISGERVLVKLDLQGAEPIALEGMGSLWGRCAGVLSEVTLGPGGTYEVLDRIMRDQGFHEFSTVNQLQLGNGRWEADKLWLRSSAEK